MAFPAEIETRIRAPYPILFVITSEEMRVQNVVVEIAQKRQKKVFEWNDEEPMSNHPIYHAAVTGRLKADLPKALRVCVYPGSRAFARHSFA